VTLGEYARGQDRRVNYMARCTKISAAEWLGRKAATAARRLAAQGPGTRSGCSSGGRTKPTGRPSGRQIKGATARNMLAPALQGQCNFQGIKQPAHGFGSDIAKMPPWLVGLV
jgi:hypothetical protein